MIGLQIDCSASMMYTDGSSIDDMCDKSTWFRVVTNQHLPVLVCLAQAGSLVSLAGRCHPKTAQTMGKRQIPGTAAIPI